MFVYQRLKALAQLTELRVCSPTPWFPLLKSKPLGVQDIDTLDVQVYRPSFFYIPGIFKNLDGWFYGKTLLSWAARITEEWQPDLMDAHFVWPDGVGVAHLARRLNLPYVVTLRGKIYECLKSSSQTKQCAEALRGASAVISVSSKMAEVACKLGVAEHRIHVIPNGVDRKNFYARDKVECRRILGLPEDGRLLVTVAHLGHRKGHNEVIEALARLPDDVRLIIVGGPAQGGSAEKLQTVAAQFGVASRVILPGPQPYDRIPYFFSAADASVLASYREGCPNAVLESLACGTPVIATDVGAVPDILTAPDVGRIVPIQQIELLHKALDEVLNESWDPAQVIRKSRVRCWEEVASDVRIVMRNILGFHSQGLG